MLKVRLRRLGYTSQQEGLLLLGDYVTTCDLNEVVSDLRRYSEFKKMKISTEGDYADDGAKITTGGAVGESGNAEADGYAKNPITIRDLFTMSAGLDYALGDEPIKKALNAGKKTTRELVRAMADKVLLFEPGTRYRYSLCHDVLGALVEVLSGKTLGEYMKENIFEPLGMKNTFFGLPKNDKDMERMAARYCFESDGTRKRVPLECVYNLSDQYESGGAGLTSCTEDYALFLDAIANGGIGKSGKRILSASTVELMGTNHLTGKRCADFDAMRAGYGYGLGVRTHIDKVRSGSLSPIGEFGWDGAAGGFAVVDTKNQLSLTYFQHVHNWSLRIQTEMRNILYSCLD